ncbi:MAG: pilus assembly protein TadG-related protein [Alphaproteobacteria bacterium]|nr:pilus assembly protein TadG-related protein [Alphaproteobacteria bacterium]
METVHQTGKTNRRISGNVAMLYALGIVPILTVVGFAVDLNRSNNARLHVQEALDAAVLSAAKMMQTEGESAAVDQQVLDLFVANLEQIGVEIACDAPVVVKSTITRSVDGSVDCDLETRIMSIFGTDQMEFTRVSRASYSINKLEVAFMFDVSGSMAGSKLVDLKLAAGEGFDILFDLPVAASGDMRVGITTFATALNAGSYFEAVTNLTNPRIGPSDPNPNSNPPATMVTTSGTCVTERPGGEAFTDAPPASGQYIPAQNDFCPVSSIVALTDDRAEVDAAVDALVANGYTAGHIGIAWTWYVLSPAWAAIWPGDSDPMAYDTPSLSKVAVLMTDGEFNSSYEASNGNTQTQARALCDAMKAQGVQIFSIAFDAPAAAEAMMTYCASPGSFYSADNGAELQAAYQAIAVRISRLRIAS